MSPPKALRKTSPTATPDCSTELGITTLRRGRGRAEITRPPLLLRHPLQHGESPGQHRVHIQRQTLPGHGLALAHLEAAHPVEHLAPVQAHQGMGVVMLGHFPHRGLANGDTQFLDQLTPQRLLHRLTGLQLAPWELPIPGIRLALGA